MNNGGSMTKSTRPLALGRLREHFDVVPWQTAKVWIVLSLVSIGLIWFGWRFGDRFGLLFGFFSAISLLAVVFFYGEWHLASLFPGEPLEGQDPWGVLSQTRELAETLSIPAPSVQLVPHETPFAFSSGIFATQTRVFVSEGLVQKLSPAEVQAVLTYEMQRLRYAHTRAASAAMALAGILASIANSFDSLIVFPFRLRSKRWRPWAPATLAALPLMALLVRLAVSRRAVFEADRLTARTMDGSRALADALMKLDAYGKTMPVDVNLAEASLFTVNPLARKKGWRFAFPQPPAEQRIHALLGHYPP